MFDFIVFIVFLVSDPVFLLVQYQTYIEYWIEASLTSSHTPAAELFPCTTRHGHAVKWFKSQLTPVAVMQRAGMCMNILVSVLRMGVLQRFDVGVGWFRVISGIYVTSRPR